ncbi:NAD(P)-dependent oxidoreductase [Sulfuriroseicoccus oceanibius]|uniref:NAD(P)-dependent oxidoreductase n=2 Tax=Sulfuriroseicoccus oceanibius TaxID=2707525 RepID=A0A7T7JDS8_9BACT|nr:NAD(P)-dependent oxidoreductase [Sulfuriroseicoccus oceanibius]
MQPAKVLSRRPKDQFSGRVADLHTDSINELVDNCDLIVECSGDVHHATPIVDAAMNAGLPVVTMATEFHVTVGSYFAGKGLITEAEGDQPGCLAALHEEAVEMGFSPLVYGNIKGFLNHQPTVEDMEFWSNKQGISVPQVTSFTDGTKIQMEQAFVANGLKTDILTRGLSGIEGMGLEEGGNYLAERAEHHGKPISDYVLNGKLPPGVFITGRNEEADPNVLRYLKLGDGPFYTLIRPYHLCHLEIPRTIRRVLDGGGVLLNNTTTPTINVCAIAKKDIAAGTDVANAIGGQFFRGEATRIADEPNAVPIGLMDGCRVIRNLEAGQTVTLDDIELRDTQATQIWQSALRPQA